MNRLNNLVYVQFNVKLMNKQKREKKRNIDVLLASDDTNAQGQIVDGGDDEVGEPSMSSLEKWLVKHPKQIICFNLEEILG